MGGKLQASLSVRTVSTIQPDYKGIRSLLDDKQPIILKVWRDISGVGSFFFCAGEGELISLSLLL